MRKVAVAALLGSVLVFWLGLGALAYSLAALSVAVYAYASERRSKAEFQALCSHQEAVLDARRVIDHQAQPLPVPSRWAVGTDMLALTGEQVLRHRPEHIVELGGGRSTAYLAMLLHRLGSGRITSFDHDAHYAEQTRAALEQRGLGDRVHIVTAPLRDTIVEGESYPWYGLEAWQDRDPIDMLLVDGPPAKLVKQSRFPAVPQLWERLSPEAVILVDDADRPDEREMIRRWEKRYGLVVHEVGGLEGGAAILRSGGEPAAS